MMFKIQTWYRDLFWEWCQKNNITCEYQGTESTIVDRIKTGYDIWYIGNEKDRAWAILKWL